MLEAQAATTFHVAFRPHIKGEALQSGACRQLVGGVRVIVHKDTPEMAAMKRSGVNVRDWDPSSFSPEREDTILVTDPFAD